jgi:hypothetical protein
MRILSCLALLGTVVLAGCVQPQGDRQVPVVIDLDIDPRQAAERINNLVDFYQENRVELVDIGPTGLLILNGLCMTALSIESNPTLDAASEGACRTALNIGVPAGEPPLPTARPPTG